jgi:outer membrane protein assembly factor BamB
VTGKHHSFANTLALAVSVVATMGVRGNDWPQWRGSNRDGVWRETGILAAIPSSGLKVRWRARVGSGYSGPVVAQGRVFITDRRRHPEVERILCFEEATGKPLWVHVYPCDYEDMEYGNGPRASPTVHDGRVYALGTKGHLFCLDAAKGEVLWKKDLAKEYNARIPRYGASAAPLVEGDLLIVCAGGQPEATVIAFDRNSGKECWRALKDRPAYSPPIAITSGGCRQVIVWTADNVSALEPATGKVYWQVPYKTTFDEAQVVATPVLRKDLLLFLTAWNRGSFMLKLDSAKPAARLLWKTRNQPTTTMSTPVFLDDGHFYAVADHGRSLCCIDAASGKEVWATEQPTSGGHAHLTPNGERVFIFNQLGHLILAKLTPAGYQELGHSLLVEPTAGYRAQRLPVTWAHPAYANKCVFARNDRELVCASLAAEAAREATEPKYAVKSRILATFTERNSAVGLSFSPDGKTLALGTWRGPIMLRDLSSGKDLPGPPRRGYFLCSVAFSPNGKLLVSVGGNEFKGAWSDNKTTAEVKLWDVAARSDRGQLIGHTNKVFTAAFAPDGKTLATGSADQTVRLWDVTTGKERATLKGHSAAVRSVAFSADSKTVVSGSEDRTVRLWDTSTGTERGCLKGHDEEVLAVAISPDGKAMATGSSDWTIRLWDLATKKEQAVLKGHQGAVYCLAFSADGKTLASGSGDETVKLWHVPTRKERAALRGHRSGIAAVAFAPDGRTLASSGLDDAVRLWELTPDQ